MKRRAVILAGAMLAAAIGCASQAPVSVTEETPVDGPALYSRNCSACHGALSATSKPGRRPARIKSAISHNFGGMAFLSKLSDEDISSIADALLLVTPPKDAGGEQLYTLYCEECHRSFNDSDIQGKSVEDIHTALKDKMCNTISLEFLGDEELRKVAAALGASPSDNKPGAVEGEPAGFEANRFVICAGVSDREPVGVASEFAADTERVYAFLEAKNIERNAQVYFVWYLEGVEAGRDKIRIGKGARWRTYCYKLIRGNAGHWRVDVQGPKGGAVVSAEFDIK